MTESTDRELIELAAKAAGYHRVEFQKGLGLVAIGQPEKANMLFNPLQSDADAFRLAVRLGITIEHMFMGGPNVAAMTGEKMAIEYFHSNRYAATRRAITRAAAEIGKAM